MALEEPGIATSEYSSAIEKQLPTGLIEAVCHLDEKMDEKNIRYLAVGSSCGSLNGDEMRTPNDLDVILLEQDEMRRINNERTIDEYNQSHGFKIDDKLTRLGTVYLDSGDLYVHGNGTVYRLAVPQAHTISRVQTMPPRELITLTKTLVDGRPDDPKANRMIKTLEDLTGTESNAIPLAMRVGSSPRDRLDRSVAQYEELILCAIQDLKNQGGASIKLHIDYSHPRKLALIRKIKGKLIVPFSGSDTSLFEGDRYNWLYQRWDNFGRHIVFHKS